VTGSSFAGK
jgi:hypothetical protein